ncbi:hypothetical protein GH741_05310 [Aquibacillus halophilus]|uniref:Sporulation protein YtfJ n=1 Tax=Aquibacillus halophilus TaxID=930132 RepID=A0A6A8DLF9_9BACI|nr:spore germination protein GerW family protein [Aquibacillus halophilus]MRH42092.1 hypothetical protein [Aquibacillus halophilus]
MGNESFNNQQSSNNEGFRISPSYLFEKFGAHKDITLVYGEPIEVENRKVLPVAKVSYMFGGGGGFSEIIDKLPSGQGEGGGGFVSIKPVGVYDISAKKTTYKPIFDFKLIVICFTLPLLLFSWRKRNKNNNHRTN